MPKTIYTKREGLEETLDRLGENLSEPVYRALHGKSQEEYLRTSVMSPKPGSLSVGEGVFFTNSTKYAVSFEGNIVVIADLRKFREKSKVVDTRVCGYEREYEERLRQEKPGFNGYDLWFEIQKDDTITIETENKSEFVYSRRKPVAKDELEYEIIVLD